MTITALQPSGQAQVAAFILGIQNDEFHLDFTPGEQPDLRQLTDFYRTGGFWVARLNGEVVGTLGLQRLDADTAILRKLFVKRELRGTTPKVAELLYARLLGAAHHLGIRTIYLDTPAIAAASHRFYERHGFVEVVDKQTLPLTYAYPDRDSRIFRLVVA